MVVAESMKAENIDCDDNLILKPVLKYIQLLMMVPSDITVFFIFAGVCTLDFWHIFSSPISPILLAVID